MNRKPIGRLALLLALLTALSGCAPQTESAADPPKPQQSVSAPCTFDTRSSEPEPEIVPTQEPAGSTSEPAVTTAEPTEELTAEPGGTVSAEPASTEQTSPPTAEPVVSREAEPTREPEIPTVPEETTTPPQTTTAAPPEKPEEPVKVVIPEVMVPLSPGKSVAECDKAALDYSNASQGYISVCWNDSGKRVKLRLIFGDRIYDHDVATGGVTEYFPLSCGSGSYKAQLYEQTEGDKYVKVLEQEFSAKISPETTPFLYPNKYVDFSKSSACVEKAAQLCAGASGDIERLAAIFGWITDNVTYDRQLAATVKSGYVPDPDSVLEKKTGICYDYASLMAAMCRSQGIPARLVIGYAAENIYHAWNEVWTEESGWITPELLLSRNGYNITDATFYAGSSDKEKIAAYISDSGNYSALYYY